MGSFRASGTLRDQAGRPVIGAAIHVTLTPLEGPGTLESYTLMGTVPEGADRAAVGLRVNTECGCLGQTDLSLYGVEYQGGGRANAVPDGEFGHGKDGWSLRGTVVAEVKPSDRGAGSMLRVRATRQQAVVVDSPRFAVRPGDAFSVAFDARVSPASEGSGYFVVLFSGRSGEVGRERIPFTPATFDLGIRVTDEKGFFRATFHPPGALLHIGPVRVDAWFAGDGLRGPASATGTIQA